MDRGASFGDHAAPCGIVGRYRQVHEGQDRLDDHGDSHFQRQQHHDRGKDIRQDFPQHDPDPAPSRDAGRGDVIHRALCHRLGPDHAGEARPVDDHDGNDDRKQARPQNGDQQDREQDRRKCHPDVDQSGNRHVHPAPQEPRQKAQRRPDQAGHRTGDQCHHQRDPCPVDDARQHVATKAVRAQQVAGFRPGHPEGRQAAKEQVLRQGVLGCDPRREKGGKTEKCQPTRRKPQPKPRAAADKGATVKHGATSGSARHREGRRSGSRP